MEVILDAGAKETLLGLATQGELRWQSGSLDPREHTRQLLPALLLGLRATSTPITDITLIVVALGPGPFNGLRVSASLAKGLATGLGVAIVGISTLEAEAYRCDPSCAPVHPVVSAGRTGFVTSSYDWNGDAWVAASEPVFVAGGHSLPYPDGEDYCGDAAELFELALQSSSGAAYHTAPVVRTLLETLASLGWRRFEAGSLTPASELQPYYVRPPHITIARERRP